MDQYYQPYYVTQKGFMIFTSSAATGDIFHSVFRGGQTMSAGTQTCSTRKRETYHHFRNKAREFTFNVLVAITVNCQSGVGGRSPTLTFHGQECSLAASLSQLPYITENEKGTYKG